MRHPRIRSTFALASTLIAALFLSNAVRADDATLHFGGCGGVYFLAEPGELWVELEKQDRNATSRKTHLRAVFAGPDRTVLHDEYLPDVPRDEKNPPVQRLRLHTQVETSGIYALNITVTEDRYGEDIAWGFRTNCAHYLVETSRGHRDATHEEPLVLRSPGQAGEVCFRPERGAFTIDIAGYPADHDAPVLCDAAGTPLATLAPGVTGAIHHAVLADATRGAAPWRLRMPAFAGTVHIDGVTRWPKGSAYPNFSLWTPDAASWFAFHENRWLVTPYHQHAYTDGEGTVAYEVHNNSSQTRTFDVRLDFPSDAWPVTLATDAVTIDPGETVEVPVSYHLPGTGDLWEARVCVQPRDTPIVTTYASLIVHHGVAPATKRLDLPLVLKPYQHENAQFGYEPAYPLTNQVYFDTRNRPWIPSDNDAYCCKEDGWKAITEAELPGGAHVPLRTRASKVAFDESDTVYLLGEVAGKSTLLYARPGDGVFRACAIPGSGALDIAQFSGHNTTPGPPPIVRYTRTQKDPNLIWRSLNDLELLLPEMDADGTITMPDSIRISAKCIGFSAHSGIPSSVVARDGKVHIAWGEATDPEVKVPGVPTYVATYDRATDTLGAPALVGYGPPANDVHNTPCITMDSQGYLHVLVGTHGRTFKYARSLKPNDAGSGWTEAEEIGPGLRQTYVGLVCGEDDTLHLVFRLWRDDRDYFPASLYATLTYMCKRPGEPWSEPKPLVIAAFADYSIFYHRLTIDREGRLFLSYDYWSTYWFYRTDRLGNRRALMMSPDGGDTWKLAKTVDLMP